MAAVPEPGAAAVQSAAAACPEGPVVGIPAAEDIPERLAVDNPVVPAAAYLAGDIRADLAVGNPAAASDGRIVADIRADLAAGNPVAEDNPVADILAAEDIPVGASAVVVDTLADPAVVQAVDPADRIAAASAGSAPCSAGTLAWDLPVAVPVDPAAEVVVGEVRPVAHPLPVSTHS